MKKRLVLSVLCLSSLCLLNEWLVGFQALKATSPDTTTPDTTTPDSPCKKSGGRNVTILLWYWPFSRTFDLGRDVCWDLYRIPGCRLVDQRSSFPSADVVVFHNKELVQGRHKLPLERPRPQCQRWAWMSIEAPVYNGNLKPYANIFNMTISYRRDADITVPYGELRPKDTRKEDYLVDGAPMNKSFLACWVVSNYRSQHNRSKVYEELRAVVPVEVYGRWSMRPLPTRALLRTISRCYFYLAFENTAGKDYITEKLWRNAYQGGAVPVVMGPSVGSYKAVAPPNSFIHVDEFASARELGEHLRRLAEDKKRYRDHFTWRRRWTVKLYSDWRERLCQICSQFSSLPPQKVYSDLEAWVNAAGT